MRGRSERGGCFVGGHRTPLRGTFLKPRRVGGIKSRSCGRRCRVWGVLFWKWLVGSGFYVVPFCI